MLFKIKQAVLCNPSVDGFVTYCNLSRKIPKKKLENIV